jgi:DNA-directed RNA polymerase specialized sigma24 family protein
MKKHIEELSELYLTGFSLKEIDELTGIPYSTVRARLVSAGVKMRPRGAPLGNNNRWGTPQEVFIKTAFLYEQMGWSTAEIGEHMGVSQSTARDRLLSHGVKLRGRSEAIRLRFKRRGFKRDNGYLTKREN